ncbi:xanthine dehydrogenase family protein molybdopterin-binding subunit [Candidatus Xianfuyuplasma coldseepsis]|uniref:Molybdopterin-dependent oxidoreductase n=1 Tax=Candidatus Xianfuyuplasma coldseepsis TaxID=2782163 RepID=A0A7L7KNS4_9MOLU|nr:molybdopterin cofactor-binding domain-containing protein [Xianfuyuplasma coldseepsis]QMS84410.1 molybdopterin-dependent oxidoreductase [Xianfuyuplasma coldseepsis]
MKLIKQPIPSVDGKGLMMGRPAYTDDLAEPNSLIVKVLRSPHPHAKIVHINTDKALSIPGVELVLTYKDFKRIPFTRAGQGYPEPSPHDKFVLDQYVRHVGDEVACVAAKTEALCDQALDVLEVEYDILQPVLDFEQAIDHDVVLHPEDEVHEMFPIGYEPKRNIAASYHMEVGDVEAELKKCDVVINETFYTQAQMHAMMEPHTVNARIDFQNRLVLYSATQTPFHVRRIISQTLEVPLSKIRVIKPRVGGGFGGKQSLHGEMLVSAVTLRTGKPAKMVYTRKEVFEASPTRHKMRIKMTLGADKDGTLRAIDCHVLSDTGAYGEHALTVFMVAGSKVLPLYNKVNSVRFYGDVVYTNHNAAGAFRGYGAIQGNFALESAIDILCEKLGIDPLEFRDNNMMKEGETSPIFAIMGEGTEGTAMTMDSCKLEYCLHRGREVSKWNEIYPYQQISPTKRRAIGMAIAMQGSGIPYIDMGSATIKLNDDGFFNLLIGATDIGQGSDTVLAQIAAEVLGCDMDHMIVYSSDSDLTPFDTGAYASSTTYVSGNAVYKAAMKMKQMMIEEAAKRLDADVDDVEFDGTMFIANTQSLTINELANRLYYNDDQRQLMATSSYVGHKSPPPFMTGYADITIDIETGEYDINNYTSIVDCGTPLNTMLARGQVEGGIVQGIGMASYEDVKYSKSGRLITNDFVSYLIPTRHEIKNLTTEFAESYEETGPFGAKSVGEIGIDTPPAAIANAIYNAVGVRITELPITPEKIRLAMLRKDEQ